MADASDPFPDLGSVCQKSVRQVNHLSQNVADIKLGSARDGDKENSWESENRVGSNTWFPQESTINVWGRPNVIQKLRMQSNRGSEKATGNAWPSQNADPWSSSGRGSAWSQQGDRIWGNDLVKSLSIEHGENGPGQPGHTSSNSWQDGQVKTDHQVGDILDDTNGVNEYEYDDNDVVYESGELDDYLSDSDEDEKSHERRKKSKRFNAFFETLEKLSVEEINSPVKQWHCPACQGGPGAINWYRGLLLMTHALTKTKRRAKMHRVFAEILVEEMRRRGTFFKPVNDAFGRWEGLNDRVADHEIVWPPMVIFMNTRYEQDENGKWTGMGNQELLNYFSSYAAVKARHSYGPQGHRGMSVLIFDSSAAGYLEAARLHKHFKEQGRDRDAWDSSRVPFCPGGKRQLYGYIVTNEDLDIFNRHSQGKSKLKFETRSYKQMVESQIKKITDDSQQLTQLKKKVALEQQHSQVLAESLGCLNEKLRQTTEENYVVQQRARLHHEQNNEELGAKEQYYKEKVNIIYQAIDAKEGDFEKLQKAVRERERERERVKQSNANVTSNLDDYSATEMEETAKSIIIQEKKMEEFDAEREKLIKSHQERRLSITQKYWEELIGLEKGFEKQLTLLMEKYSQACLEEGTTTTTTTALKLKEKTLDMKTG